MFSASFYKNPFFLSFVFKMFSALDRLSSDGHDVAIQFVPGRLGTWDIINPFWLRVRGDEAQD
jgi:hypothetical protein